MTWKAWEDDENTETDSFTVTNAVEESRGQGSNPVMLAIIALKVRMEGRRGQQSLSLGI